MRWLGEILPGRNADRGDHRSLLRTRGGGRQTGCGHGPFPGSCFRRAGGGTAAHRMVPRLHRQRFDRCRSGQGDEERARGSHRGLRWHGARGERPRRADHPRHGGDAQAQRRPRRQARDSDGAGWPRRSRAHLHGRSLAQSPPGDSPRSGCAACGGFGAHRAGGRGRANGADHRPARRARGTRLADHRARPPGPAGRADRGGGDAPIARARDAGGVRLRPGGSCPLGARVCVVRHRAWIPPPRLPHH